MNKMNQSTIDFVCNRFGLKPEDVAGYNAGVCYNRVLVKSQEAANKVVEKVKDDIVNGGWFHGQPLGRITKYDGFFDVTC